MECMDNLAFPFYRKHKLLAQKVMSHAEVISILTAIYTDFVNVGLPQGCTIAPDELNTLVSNKIVRISTNHYTNKHIEEKSSKKKTAMERRDQNSVEESMQKRSRLNPEPSPKTPNPQPAHLNLGLPNLPPLPNLSPLPLLPPLPNQ